ILTAVEPATIGGAQVRRDADEAGRPASSAVLAELAREGVATVLIECGGREAASFLRAGLVATIEWFRALILLGWEGRPCVAGLAIGALDDAPLFERLAVEALGPDLWERYERRR